MFAHSVSSLLRAQQWCQVPTSAQDIAEAMAAREQAIIAVFTKTAWTINTEILTPVQVVGSPTATHFRT